MANEPGIRLRWSSAFSFGEPTVQCFAASAWKDVAIDRVYPFKATTGISVDYGSAAKSAFNAIMNSVGVPEAIFICLATGPVKEISLEQLEAMRFDEPKWYHRADCSAELWASSKF
jgi:hypothetical protein